MKDSYVRREAHWMVMSFFLAVAGCGGDSGTNGGGGVGGGYGGGGGSGGGGTTPVVTTSVNVVDFDFTPPDIQVTAGAMVTWTWTGAIAHNVTFAVSSGVTNGPLQVTGTHVAQMPTATGTYTYQCTIHPLLMQGSVIVP